MENYCRAYAPRFHLVPDSRYWPDKNVKYIILPPEVSRPRVARGRLAYAILWMKSLKVIDVINVAITSKLVITRLGVLNHHLPLGKFIL